jgi:hypothetical protein
MKKIILISILFLSVLVANAQRGRVYSVAVDTLNGNETVNFTLGQVTGSYDVLTIQALCSNIGGTSDGTLILQGSVDGTSYLTINDATGVLKGYPNDTLTITDGAVVQYVVDETPWNFYRIQGAGTANDSTLVTVKYVYK